MSEEVLYAAAIKIKRYVEQTNIDTLSIVFHGGEPLLFPKKRYKKFLESIREIAHATGCKFTFSMQTNATLLDDAWAEFLAKEQINVGVSIDGPQEVHDLHRVDRRGQGSFLKTLLGVEAARRRGFHPAFLVVCNPMSNPTHVASFMVDTLKARSFDVLIPNFNQDDFKNGRVKPIADYYIRLIDDWFDRWSLKGVQIRFVESVLRVLLGGPSSMLGLGGLPTTTIEILPDGAIEPHDVLRIGGSDQVKTALNVKSHEIIEILDEPSFKIPYEAAYNLPSECLQCEFVSICGGGHVYHRFSRENGYTNPSIYCTDLKRIFRHAAFRLEETLGGKTISGTRHCSDNAQNA